MRFSALFFDLDGTLTESGPGIMHAARYAIEKQGYPVPEESVLRRFVGPPLEESFMRWCGMSREEALSSIPIYREYYLPVGAYENAPYPGIPALLKEAREAGLQLAVATAKPEAISRTILSYFGLDGFFSSICGLSEAEGRLSKRDAIAHALACEHITDRSSVLMIGDRENDIDGARFNGLASCGVLYGYGSREELENAGADHIVSSVDELKKLILS